MQIVTRVGEYQIRGNRLLESLEPLFDLGAGVREKSVAETVDLDVFRARIFQERFSALLGFNHSRARTSKDYPPHHSFAFCQQSQNGSATSDFHIIGMRTET